MENGGRSFDSQLNISNDARVPRSVIVTGEVDNGSMNMNIPGNVEFENPNPSLRNPEEYVPVANIMRIMKRALPPHAKVADDAKETVQECLTEFISLVTSEANARCHRECRKTITADDLITAMARLGFNDYVFPLSHFLDRYRESDPERRAARSSVSFAPPRLMAVPPNYVEQQLQLQLPRLDGGGEGFYGEAEFGQFGSTRFN